MQILAQSSPARSQRLSPFTHFYYAVGAALVISACAIFAIDVLSLGMGQSIAVWQGFVGLTSGIAFVGWQQQQAKTVPIAVLIITILGLFALSLLLSGLCYDTSWDGQTYHQEAILQLAQGWNPIYTALGESNVHSIWLDHYTKASWFLAANLYKTTGQLETAKAFNLIFLIGSGLLSVSVLSSVTRHAWMVSLLMTFNPIAISQVFNFTIDGQVASLLLCLGVSLFAIALQAQNISQWLPIVICSIALLANIKFTALAYAIVFAAGLIVWMYFNDRKRVGQVAFASILAIAISLVGLGYQPYVTNLINQGNLFYPLTGADKVDIISAQIPVDFVGKNRVEKFLRSTFAVSDATRNTTSQLKFPLSIQRRELVAMIDGARVGGFGPWFAAALCLAGVMVARYAYQTARIGLFAIPCVILISTLINPEAWWARYVPQVWLLAPLALLLGKPQKWISLALVCILSFNSLLVVAPTAFATVRGNWRIHQQMQMLSDVKQVAVKFDTFGGNRSRFIERSIAWKEVETLPCPQAIQFFKSNTQFCVLSK
ncbi:MAG: hypothetical protein MUC48_07120 [Leptolyngbya sp. Prado105]|jgi:hypothetical protein|nr:hypothetical protein [Leptolyngbya sp. Prado105]